MLQRQPMEESEYGVLGVDPLPCNAPPGSRERLEVYGWRLEHGYEIFHPAEPTCFAEMRDQEYQRCVSRLWRQM